MQTTQLSAEQLQAFTQSLNDINTVLDEQHQTTGLKGRKHWIAKEEYGHNGVMHSETTPILGASSPIAPGLSIWLKDGKVFGSVNYSHLYEGGNDRVHGGWIAAVFDEFLATAMALTGRTGVTAYLTTNYRSYTPVDEPLQLEAELVSVEGKKVFVKGTMHAGERLCADADALFILQGKIPKRD